MEDPFNIRKSTSSSNSSGDNILSLVLIIPKNASENVLQTHIESVLEKMQRVTHADTPYVERAIQVLKEQPNIIPILVRYYETQSKEAYDKRMLSLRLIGSMQLPAALPFLKKVVWESLPDKPAVKISDVLTERDREEMIQSKAVQGIACLRTDESFDEVLNIILEHDSFSVRLEAIDAYMWNHNDSVKARQRLRKELPKEFHRYLERPRFHANMNPDEFNTRLEGWLKKWGGLSRTKGE